MNQRLDKTTMILENFAQSESETSSVVDSRFYLETFFLEVIR